ncbi:transcriptional regulator [Massilia pinisoli]|uniref:Transcriptional regulator n=1 Tax=Massilia pinisoli TaxID=1772194 RepID=A0ABT1ZWA1_9BURK|nr:transcriptional regulator [Massilia pinisoli]MCS0584218.1 transcriptional regulator [Massilia pinisoli]
MRLIEADELRQFSEILKSRSCSLADFELYELDTTDPKSDELSPMKGFVQIRRKSNDVVREYVTGDGTSWVSVFEKDLGTGRFG